MAIFDITYVGDMPYLKLEGGTVTGATTFTNNIAASTINGVTVGSDPKFTDTTYSVATTSANGLLPALGGGTTNYLRADGSWAKPPGTTYSVATTSANGLMAAADKVAVNKIGTGTLNTTNKTIIPAINELVAKGVTPVPFEASVTIPKNTTETSTLYSFNQPCVVFFKVTNGTSVSNNSAYYGSLRLPYSQWSIISVVRPVSGLKNGTYSGSVKTMTDLLDLGVNTSTGEKLYYSIHTTTTNSVNSQSWRNITTDTQCVIYSADLSLTSFSINARVYDVSAQTVSISGFYIPLT